MKFKRIEEQDKVLSVFDKNTIVAASAGSGKTSVLIQKISSYIKNKVDVSNILALTYTNAAASEMKERLAASLFAYIESELTDEEKEKFIPQIDKLTTSDISTFHSFYERIIKKYFYILGIDPSFKILTEEDNLILKMEAFESAVNELKEEDFENYLKISDILGKKRKDDAIRERIFKLDEFLSSQFDKEKWLRETAKNLYANKEKTYAILREDILENIRSTISSLDNLLKVSADEEYLISHINQCCSALSSLKGSDFEEIIEKLTDFRFPELYKAKVKINFHLIEKVKNIKEKFTDFVKVYKNEFGDLDVIESSFQTCSQNVQIIIDLYINYIEFLNDKKKEINSYDFSDLEEFCYKLLQNDRVRNDVREQYELIFVDEFQDTNPIQYEIIKLISKGNNVFIVGDPKQSIYAFRQTDVDIFNNVFDEFSKDFNSEALTLKSNFRSNKNILDFVNNIFDVLMTKGLSGIDYRKDARFEARSENSCEGKSVVVSVVKNGEKEKNERAEGIYDIFNDTTKRKDAETEAKLIAHQISKVIKEKIYDDELREDREVEYRDIAVLLRNRSDLLTDLIKVFNKYNIPFSVNDKVDLLSSKEVLLLISLLKICLNIKDDMNLAPVLVSEFAGLNYDEMTKIRLVCDDEFFYNCCLNYLTKDDEISGKLRAFYVLIDEIKYNIEFKGIEYALYFAINKMNFLEKLRLNKDGNLRVESVQQFLSFISQSKFNNDLPGLIDFIDNSRKIIASSVNKCDDNSVSITTIHGSKGLEYPVVFLCDTGRDLNKSKPETADLKISKNWGIAIKNYDEKERKIYPSIFERIIKIEDKKKEAAENLRLLYVALTRAKNKLFISGTVSKEFASISNAYEVLNVKPNSYLNLIIGTLSGKEIDEINIGADVVRDDAVINIVESVEFVEDGKNNIDVSEKRLNKIKEYLINKSYKYPFKSAAKLAQKTSVTKIVLDANSQESLTSEPINFWINENLNGRTVSAEKGIVLHKILENISFTMAGKPLKDDIVRLVKLFNENEVFDEDYLCGLIEKNITNIKKILPPSNRLYREKQFLLYCSPHEIFGEGDDEKILIQGKLDLISVGNKNIVIDYKYTSIKDDSAIINKYKKQLITYSYAVEKALSVKIDEIYIQNLLSGQPIKIK